MLNMDSFADTTQREDLEAMLTERRVDGMRICCTLRLLKRAKQYVNAIRAQAGLASTHLLHPPA